MATQRWGDTGLAWSGNSTLKPQPLHWRLTMDALFLVSVAIMWWCGR
jgi:hypothetical protein